MITKQDFTNIIDYKEQHSEIPMIGNTLKIVAWENFTQKRNTDDFIASSESEDAIYDREIEIAEETINAIAATMQ